MWPSGADQDMKTPASLDADRALPSPGMLAKHYSPRAPLTLYLGADERAIGRLIADARALSNDGSQDHRHPGTNR